MQTWSKLHGWSDIRGQYKSRMTKGGGILGNDFKISFIEQEYGIKTKTASSGDPLKNATMEQIRQVLGNIVRTYNLQGTYTDDDDLWIGILVSADFSLRATYHHTKKQYGPISFWARHDPPNQSYS